PARKRTHRGQFRRGGRARQPLLVQLAEKAAQRRAIELRRLQIALLQIRISGDVADELREIALVGADGVRRRVAVVREKLQERLEVLDHRYVGRPEGRPLRSTLLPPTLSDTVFRPCWSAT